VEQVRSAQEQGRLRFKTEKCDLYSELDGEDGYCPPPCPFYPGPQDCLRCPDEKLRMEATIRDWDRRHPGGEVRLAKKRHCTLVHFLDDQGQSPKQPEKFRIRYTKDRTYNFLESAKVIL
jgi:hypothetical protein